MADIFKVMDGLKCCVVRQRGDNRRCPECPYRDPTTDCTNEMMKDALEVFNTQMTGACEACSVKEGPQ